MLDAWLKGQLSLLGVSALTLSSRNIQTHQVFQSITDQAVDIQDCGSLRIRNLDALRVEAEDLEGCDLVIHAAASSDARDYATHPAAQHQLIVEGTRQVINACAKTGCGLLYLSSGAVYGRQPDSLALIPESFPTLQPGIDPSKATYALAKLEAEQIVRLAAQCKGFPALIARCFSFAGPRLPRDQHFAFGNFMADALAARPIVVRARHAVYRSYMYADDLAQALIELSKRVHTNVPTINVGSSEPVEIRELANIIGDVAGVSVEASDIDWSLPIDRYTPCVKHFETLCQLHHPNKLQDTVRKTWDRLTLRNHY